MVHNMQKPTKEQVDMLLAEGFSTRQIAKKYGWSAATILDIHHAGMIREQAKKQAKLNRQSDWKMPITREERIEAKQKCQIGDIIRVYNHWKSKKETTGYGLWEMSRIKRKFRYLVLLENGRTVDYAEIARQRRNYV